MKMMMTTMTMMARIKRTTNDRRPFPCLAQPRQAGPRLALPGLAPPRPDGLRWSDHYSTMRTIMKTPRDRPQTKPLPRRRRVRTFLTGSSRHASRRTGRGKGSKRGKLFRLALIRVLGGVWL